MPLVAFSGETAGQPGETASIRTHGVAERQVNRRGT